MTIKDIETFRSNLHLLGCPGCGKRGTMVKHGYIWGYPAANADRRIRAWRICCKKRKSRKGCGHAPSVRLSETIPLHCFSASDLWRFILALKKNRSINAAWNLAQIGTTVDTGYRIYRRLCLCQSTLRTHLLSRGPPPDTKNASAPLFQVFKHLEEVFGKNNPVGKYQEDLQRSILATK